MKILVTGGAGYIGSHAVVELIRAGHEAVIADNLSNSSEKVIGRMETLAGKKIPFYHCDVRDGSGLKAIFSEHQMDCCIHFAGLKAVGESVLHPMRYYDNNVNGVLTLLDVMQEYGCKNMIFSSSATVYGNPDTLPIPETQPKKECTNPYGRTKSMIEDILHDMYLADCKNRVEHPWNIVLLRYFNPIGAHPSGLIGENPKGEPNNLMPYITQVASGKRERLSVFGNDYDTPDGTCIRDYIHVMDLARGHVHALSAISRKCGFEVYNLGTGKGYSVLDIIQTFERVNEIPVPHIFTERRAGDIAACYSDSSKAKKELGWTAEYTLDDMCRDSWNWQKNNPDGYE